MIMKAKKQINNVYQLLQVLIICRNLKWKNNDMVKNGEELLKYYF